MNRSRRAETSAEVRITPTLRRGAGRICGLHSFICDHAHFSGSPFDQDRELPPEVVSNQAETTGMAMPVSGSNGCGFHCVVGSKNAVVDVGAPYASVLIDGAPSTLVADAPFTVFRVIRRKGDSIPQGGAAVYRHTDISTQYLTTLRNYIRLDFVLLLTLEGNGRFGKILSKRCLFRWSSDFMH